MLRGLLIFLLEPLPLLTLVTSSPLSTRISFSMAADREGEPSPDVAMPMF